MIILEIKFYAARLGKDRKYVPLLKSEDPSIP